jgi:hypothetical protein
MATIKQVPDSSRRFRGQTARFMERVERSASIICCIYLRSTFYTYLGWVPVTVKDH